MVLLSDLLKSLPRSAPLEFTSAPHDSLSFPVTDDSFIEPSLRLESGEFAQGPVVVVSAPGAVGKTALAKYIASQTGSCMWDLSKLTLGANSFVGTLAQSFGAGKLSQILKSLAAGELLMVLDAFDEAEILSGWDRVEMFVRECWEVIKASPRPALILLARSETAGLLDYQLQELVISNKVAKAPILMEIEYFNREAAFKFVERHLDRAHVSLSANNGVAAHKQHPLPFRQAVEAVFKSLSEALDVNVAEAWDDEVGRAFLGYAPVLQTIGTYLQGFSNFNDVAAELASSDSSLGGIGLLSKLMGALLDREQQKLVDAIKKRNIPGASSWDGWGTLYDQEEQLRRLLLHTTQSPAATEVTQVPAWLVDAYSEGLRAFLMQHPFVRERSFAGPAFRDYTLAVLLGTDELILSVEAFLNGPTYVPTRLLCQFYTNVCAKPTSGRHAGHLYESAVSGHNLGSSSDTIILSPDAGDTEKEYHKLEITTHSNGTLSSEVTSLDISLMVDDKNPLTFPRHLRHAFVRVSGPVVLGVRGNEFEVCDTELNCENLSINADAILIRAYTPSQHVIMRAKHCQQASATLRVERKGVGSLVINWPEGSQHPWAQYYSEKVDTESADRPGAMLALRRILTWFRKDKKANFARYKDLVDNVAVGENPFRQRMLQFLRQRNIILDNAPLYVLNTNLAQQVGINWMDLRSGKLTPEVIPFLDEFLQFRPGL